MKYMKNGYVRYVAVKCVIRYACNEKWTIGVADTREFPAKVIQVATPEKKINEHYHKDYDVKTLWELDEDNEEGAENRCKEIECPTLSKIKKKKL